ncbi:hypothetical protein SAMN04487866_10912 [Thermoactinomyces sp. DSM 45891]|nr:hypothetical protein SAMN04487866_10912 [Thermoactinomyces sp. DSM 45891]
MHKHIIAPEVERLNIDGLYIQIMRMAAEVLCYNEGERFIAFEAGRDTKITDIDNEERGRTFISFNLPVTLWVITKPRSGYFETTIMTQKGDRRKYKGRI